MKRRQADLKIIIALIAVAILLFLAFNMKDRTMPDSTISLTEQVIEKAEEEIMHDITAGMSDIGITLPAISSAYPGSSLDNIEIVFRNTGFNPRYYMLAIELVALDEMAAFTNSGNPKCLDPSCSDFSQVRQEIEKWFSVDPSLLLLDLQETGTASVSFKLPDDAKPGRYSFAAKTYLTNPLILPGELKQYFDKSQADPKEPPKEATFQIEVVVEI